MTVPKSQWTLARHRFRTEALGVLVIWAGFVVFVLGMVLVVGALRSIQVSGWEIGSQLPRWFAGGIGVYLTAVYLPMYIAHGYTRREFAWQMPVVAVGVVLLLSALMTLGYGIERVVYGLAGWPQALTQQHLFPTPDKYDLVFAEFLLLFTVWTTAGALAGAAFYRHPVLGWIVAPFALLMVGAVEAAANPGFFEFVTVLGRFLGLELAGPTVSGAVATTLACAAVGLALTWLVIRDMPLRGQRA